MAFKAYTLTLDGTVQRLSDAFKPAGSVSGTIDPALDLPCSQIILQSKKANSNDVLVGDSTLSDTVHAFRIDPGDTAPPILLSSYEGAPLKASDFYVKGTNAEVVCFGLVAS